MTTWIKRPSRIPGLHFLYLKGERFPRLSIVHTQSGVDVFSLGGKVARPVEVAGLVDRAFAAVPFDWDRPVGQIDLDKARGAVDQVKRRLTECMEPVEAPAHIGPVWHVKESCRKAPK
jgi:hypothetical protein